MLKSCMHTRVEVIVAEFSAFRDWESRYKYLINLGRQLPELPEEFKTEELKIKGCQSQVWLKADYNKERAVVELYADSDALIVKGLVSLLLRIYSGLTPDEILAVSPQFMEQLGFSTHLSPSRANGFMSMIKQIRNYALAFKLLHS